MYEHIPVGELKWLFNYDPLTGAITHNARRHGAKHGHIAGRIDRDGYVVLKRKGRNMRGHCVAWAMYYGVWPEDEIDHINRIPNDNRIENLRNATRSQNRANSRKHRTGSAPYKGVCNVKYGIHRKWRAAICKDGKRTYLGWFDDPKEAHEAYVRAAIDMFGEFACSG